MTDIDIHNPEDSKRIQDILKHGAKGEFWDIIKQRLEWMLNNLQSHIDFEDMSKTPADEYKIRMEVLKEGKSQLKALLDMPESIVKELGDPDEEPEDNEVYETPEEVE